MLTRCPLVSANYNFCWNMHCMQWQIRWSYSNQICHQCPASVGIVFHQSLELNNGVFFLKQQSDKVNTHSIYSRCHSSLMIRLGKSIYVIHRLGGPYWEKLCPRSRVPPNTAEGGTQTEGTVSPNTDRPRLVNNIFIFFFN